MTEAAPLTAFLNSSVHPHVATVLQNSRPKFVRGNWRKAKVSGRRLAELRKMYVSMGYYWPEKPMIDRGLDTTPKGHRYEREKEARLVCVLGFNYYSFILLDCLQCTCS